MNNKEALMEKNFNFLVIFWTSNFLSLSHLRKVKFDNFLQVCRDLGRRVRPES